MTKDQMYEDIRAQMRGTSITALQALYNSLQKTSCETLPFHPSDYSLYIRCDNLPAESITAIGFLADCNFLSWRICAFNRVVDLDGIPTPIPTPYIVCNRKVRTTVS